MPETQIEKAARHLAGMRRDQIWFDLWTALLDATPDSYPQTLRAMSDLMATFGKELAREMES